MSSVVEVDDVVGRESELATLSAFLGMIEEGPTALVLWGEPGIGKTTLWRSAVDGAVKRSLRVLSCRPTEAETDLPYAGLGDLLCAVGDDALADLPGPQRSALEVALLRVAPEGPPLEQRAVAAAVLAVLARLTGEGSVLVAVDDVHWLDRPSARALTFALRRVGPAGLGVLVTQRGAAGDPTPLSLERAVLDNRLRHLDVRPLTLDALDRLLRSRLRLVLRRPVLVELHRVSGGNPLFALELGRALQRRSTPLGPGEVIPVPGSLLELVGDRLAQLSARARDVVVATAALSRPTVALVRAATPGRGLDEAVTAGVVEVDHGDVRFTHPLLASAIYSQATSEERRRLHRRLAQVVTDAEERARHLALGADGPDVAVAAALDEAAERARSRGAPDAAADLAEHACRLTPPDRLADIGPRCLRAAEHHFRAGNLQRARTLLEELLVTSPRGPQRARLLQRLGEIRQVETGAGSAAEFFERARAEAAGDRRATAIAELSLAYSAMDGHGDIRKAARHAGEALAIARQLGDDSLLREGINQVLLYEFLLGHGTRLDLWQEAVRLEERVWDRALPLDFGLTHTQHLILAAILKWSDDFDEARRRLLVAYHRGVEAGEDAVVPYVAYHLAELECWAGNWDVAVQWADEAHVAAERTGQEETRSATLYARGLVAAHRGDLERARTFAEEGVALAERAGSIPLIQLNRSVLGFLALSEGDHAGVHRMFAPLAEVLAAMGLGEPGVVRFLPDEIESLVALGEFQLAATLVDQLEERGRSLNRRSALATGRRCRALLLAAHGDVSGALVAIDEALGFHSGLGQPFELGRTLLTQGTLRRRAKQKRAAREALNQALSIFDSLGAPVWADRVRSEAARIGGRASSSVLTSTESRIADLAAAGHSNQEIANALFLSVKTVEANLTRIYAKLGVRSRRELARYRHGVP